MVVGCLEQRPLTNLRQVQASSVTQYPYMTETGPQTLQPRRRFRWWKGIILVLLLLTLFIPRTAGLRITPVELIAFEHVFSLVEWEVVNFPQKWLHSLTNLVPGSKPLAGGAARAGRRVPTDREGRE